MRTGCSVDEDLLPEPPDRADQALGVRQLAVVLEPLVLDSHGDVVDPVRLR
jgi:hypothetical protein